MRKRHNSNRAILVLEAPWEFDDSDTNRTSVIPFVEGIAKYSGDTEVYCANFYDKRSFQKALNCLCKIKFSNTIVYIAAHGSGKKIGDIKVLDALVEIGVRAKDYNVTGVMLGSCYAGEDERLLKACIEGTNLTWCAGYISSCSWLQGTMIDCSIIARMLTNEKEDFFDVAFVATEFAESIACFSGMYQVGEDYNEEPIYLKDSLQFVVQIIGKGQRARTISKKVFEELGYLESNE